jgi:hypothetical protein
VNYSDYLASVRSALSSTPLKGRGKCRLESEKMKSRFPELRVTAGYFYDPFWGKQAHWWCVAPDGTILDPTVCQFPSGEIGEPGNDWYEEVPESDRPLGRCMDCGADVYPTYVDDDGNVCENTSASTFCRPMCEDETRKYMGMRPR